jgi:hypothetical protein
MIKIKKQGNAQINLHTAQIKLTAERFLHHMRICNAAIHPARAFAHCAFIYILRNV